MLDLILVSFQVSYTSFFYRLFRILFRQQAFAATSKPLATTTWSNHFSERPLQPLSCLPDQLSKSSSEKNFWDPATEWIKMINRHRPQSEKSVLSPSGLCAWKEGCKDKMIIWKLWESSHSRPACNLLGYKRQAAFAPIFPEQSDRQMGTL